MDTKITPVDQLVPGDRYVAGDPDNAANWVTVTGAPHDAVVRSLGRDVPVVRVPVATYDGTHLPDDYVIPGATVNRLVRD